MSRPRVLLTGGSGFIGSRAIAPLLEAGYEVHAIARRHGASADVTWHELDLLDDRASADLVAEIAAEHLLHFAWITEHGRFWSAPENLDWVAASLRLLRAFADAGGRRAVLAGTCAEYDWEGHVERCVETDDGARAATPLRPATLYGACKHATRVVADAYAREAGLSLAWGRVFLLYGPGEDQRRLVPHVASALLAGQQAPTSDGAQVRDFMHVDDVAGGFVALLRSAVEGPVNIASGQGARIADVLALIADAARRPELLRIGALPRRPGEPDALVADTRRLRDEVGFAPAIALERGIAQAVASLRGAECV
ncbi:MAG TPA: NAD(P)-dependent oxidoreductase [Solirubrobacteraceae bacterium]|jgi:nucleoside-diphosphate-sugar epimerase|nr:NAD(P)-dependent oxidoreductase [Solirubrobacteraceae bacterium]